MPRTRKRRGIPGSVTRRGNKWAYAFDGPADPLTGERNRIRKSGFESEDEAWEKMAEAQAKLREGQLTKPSKRTVTQFFEEWFPKMRTSIGSPTTANNYETLARAYVIPVIGKKRLQDIDAITVASLYEHLLNSGRRRRDTNGEMFRIWQEVTGRGDEISARELARQVGVTHDAAYKAMRRFRAGRTPTDATNGLSKKTVRSVHIMLRSAFADAVTWKYVPTNPVAAVKAPSPENRSHRTWTPAELRRFLTAVQSDRLYAMWLLLATTGMRRSEVAGLRLDGLDLDNGALAVKATRVVTNGKVRQGFGKSRRSRRRLSLDKATVAALLTHVEMIQAEKATWADAYQDHGLVFCWEDGRPIYPDTITEWLARIADRLGLPHLTLHELRHTYATTALRAGVHPKIVSSRLGHATVAFTLDLYTADIPELDQAAAQEISNLFLGTPGFGADAMEVTLEAA
ncbi:Site-specific recombinase XerD [Amycolatopsis sacchari]|uniref:Site-specific recombinase XerD n=1 Tax=Amycolatopsis sacchari TaxID=115433 RepID=A0A1I3S7G5_9PSEU|nr:site-specific integrase [Amycolatopsis sacchari]SFJ54744.1 Site-specific recombinase XerD [Amycolatopsis sacchari]